MVQHGFKIVQGVLESGAPLHSVPGTVLKHLVLTTGSLQRVSLCIWVNFIVWASNRWYLGTLGLLDGIWVFYWYLGILVVIWVIFHVIWVILG